MMKILLSFVFNLIAVVSFCQNNIASVYFDFNHQQLTLASTKKLDSLIAFNPEQIILSGFCDSIGNHACNDKLSRQRINSVKQYLQSKGIGDSNFIKETGFGKRKPVNDNADLYKRSLNRRVVIEFIMNNHLAVNAEKNIISNVGLETKIKDTSIKLGDNIALPNLNFIGGRHILLPASAPYLNELLGVLKKFPTLNIEIQGHICCEYMAQDGYDFDTRTNNLSANRARAIYDYLIENGIEASRLSYKGFGNKHPKIFPEKDESDRIANRRVEIKILAK